MSTARRPEDHYRVLGVTKTASSEEIRDAYRRLAGEWNPYFNQSPDASRMTRLINEAWEVLGDDEKRAEYDRKRSEIPWRREDDDEAGNWLNCVKHVFWIFIVGPLIIWAIASGYSLGGMIDDVKALNNWLNPQTVQDSTVANGQTTLYQSPPGFVGFGPKSGTLNNDSAAGQLFNSEIEIRDFLATVSITNPETVVGDWWLGGLMVRAEVPSGGLDGEFVGIDNNGVWHHIRFDVTEFDLIARDVSTAINTKPGEENDIVVDADGATARLSVNGTVIARLNMHVPTRSGSIFVMSLGEEGTSPVLFSGFTVRGFSATEDSTTD